MRIHRNYKILDIVNVVYNVVRHSYIRTRNNALDLWPKSIEDFRGDATGCGIFLKHPQHFWLVIHAYNMSGGWGESERSYSPTATNI